MKLKPSHKIALTATFAALSLITFVLENLLPPLFLPGARLGLSNVFILLTLIFLGWQYAFAVLIVKTVLGSLFAGNLSAIMYSIPAGAISLLIQTLLLYFTKRVSVIAISVSGSVINTVTQNVVFCLVTQTTAYLSYSPYLALLGVVSGIIVGFLVYLTIKKFPVKFFGGNDGEVNANNDLDKIKEMKN